MKQEEITLNLIHGSQVHPKLSTFVWLEGEFNFNKAPLGSRRTKALIYINSKVHASWALHAIDAWYVGPAFQHYQYYRFWVPETRDVRISQTAQFFPKHSIIPQQTHVNLAIHAAQELTASLKQALLSSNSNHIHTCLKALQHLATIFQQASEPAEEEQCKPPRVKPSSSVNTTDAM